MKIAQINSNTVFSSNTKKTENGNEYKSTNVAKVVLPSISAATILLEKAGGAKLNIPMCILNLGVSVGAGFLLDHFVDKTRKEDADIFAQTNDVKDKTHKGLGIGSLIGAGYGAVYAIAVMAISKSHSAKALLSIPVCALEGLIDGGLFYDLRVNKTRKELLQRADIQKQVEQKINDANKTQADEKTE